MSGSHLAQHAAPKKKTHAEPERDVRGNEQEYRADSGYGYESDYDPAYGYEPEYDPKGSRRGGGKWKVAVLVVILLVVVAALGYLVWQLFGGDIMDRINGTTADATADIAPGITTQIGASDQTGKNLSGQIAVTEGTQRPDAVSPEEDLVLLDINWTGKKDPEGPMYVTVSDPSWPDGNGLAVHHYNHSNQWEMVGTYTIRDHAVTFLVNDLSPFAFQLISPEPSPTPEPTAEPTATPEPTPEPTPSPTQALDYGMYADVQEGVYSLLDDNKMEDDAVYVIALVQDLPEDVQDDGDADTDASPSASPADGDVDFSYVETAGDSEQPADGDPEAPGEPTPVPEPTAGPTARVLLNLGGMSLRTVDMPLVQTEDGKWCLGGAVTAGMLWTTNGEYYASNTRYSMENNGSFLNLDDNNENVILTDSGVRTRWLIQTAELSDGSKLDTLDYYIDGERHYINAMEMLTDEVDDSDFPSATPPADGTVPQPVFLGGEAADGEAIVREVLHFSVTGEDNADDALRVLLFKLDEDIETAPEGAGAAPASRIVVPVINAETNLSTMVIRDGANVLTLGQDYTVSAQVCNNSTVVVTIRFMGKYAGQIVRTYPGTTFLTNETTEPSPSPSTSPSPSPSPTATPGGTQTTSPSTTPQNTPSGQQSPPPTDPTTNPTPVTPPSPSIPPATTAPTNPPPPANGSDATTPPTAPPANGSDT